jgi:hypothetical protein
MSQSASAQSEPLRQTVRTIAGGYATAHNQARLIWLRPFQHERPSRPVTTICQPPRENEGTIHLTFGDDEHVLGSGNRGEHAPYRDVLIFGQDAVGTRMSAVVDEVVGIPSGATGAHLNQPRPDFVRRTMNRDVMIDRADGLGNQVISGERPRN